VSGLHWNGIGWHLLAGLVGLVLGFVLFALGWIGGGDAKLFAAMALWFGFNDMMAYAVVASICGGGLTLAIMMARQYPLPAILARQAWILRLHDAHSGIPYGVALAAGAFLLLPSTEIFHLAAAA
jgi:prepilin peptidase CpaA